MQRHSSAVAVTLALFSFSAVTIAQNTPSSSPIDVLYLVTGNHIETYNVDPNTGDAADYGAISVPAPDYPQVVPGVGDRFIYVVGYNYKTQSSVILVYPTDANGTPQSTPIQRLDFKIGVTNLVVDPDGSLAYATQSVQNSYYQALAGIRAFAIDKTTGFLTEFPKLSAIYPLDGPCGMQQLDSGGFSTIGFNASGGALYDAWGCGWLDSDESFFYKRQVDQQSGALGPDVQIASAGGGDGGPDTTTYLRPAAILSFTLQADYYGDTLAVYPPSGGDTPIFTCTGSMLQACGNSWEVAPDITGDYIFFETVNGPVELAKLDLNTEQIVPLDTSIPYFPQVFSLDDRLIYARNNSSSINSVPVMPIYMFDPRNGSLTGSARSISLPNQYSTPVPALRY